MSESLEVSHGLQHAKIEELEKNLELQAQDALHRIMYSNLYDHVVLNIKEKNIFGSRGMINTQGFECVSVEDIKNNEEEKKKWIEYMKQSILLKHKY